MTGFRETVPNTRVLSMPGPTKKHREDIVRHLRRGRSERYAAAAAGIKRTTFLRWMKQAREDDLPSTDNRVLFMEEVEAASDMFVGDGEEAFAEFAKEKPWLLVRMLESRARQVYGKGPGFSVDLDATKGTAKIVVAPDFPSPDE